MKVVGYIIVFAVGVFLTYLFTSYSAIYGPQSANIIETAPELFISYSDFVSFILTIVTIVLAAVAIGIGVVAAYTFREIKDDARKAVRKEIDRELEDLPNQIKVAVDLIVFRNKQTTSVDELEEGFDPTDNSER